MSLSNLPSVSNSLPVAVDAMGGDLGSAVIVEGAVQAARSLGIPVIIVGDELQIRDHLKKLKAFEDPRIGVRHAPEVVGMEDAPALAVRKKTGASIRLAFELVKSRTAGAVVSAGNTGAVMAAGIMVSGTLPGIARPAIATLIPKSQGKTPTVLLDCGANIDCNAPQLVQFALMGNYYANIAIHLPNPRVSLLSNGTEESKGNDITRAAALLLSKVPGINFIGYVEGRDLARDAADVVVCDGFVGNIVLKAIEGSVEIVLDTLRNNVDRSGLGRLGMWLARPALRSVFQTKLDPSSFGGAPFLGLNDLAVVCHGASTPKAIMNAIRVAKESVDQGLSSRIAAALNGLDIKMPGFDNENVWNNLGKRFERMRDPSSNDSAAESFSNASTEITVRGVQNE